MRRMNLILTTHSIDKKVLNDMTQKFEREFDVHIKTFIIHLRETDEAHFTINQVHSDEYIIDILINNTTFAMYNSFNQEFIESIITQILISTIRLTHTILPSIHSRDANEIVYTAFIYVFFSMSFCVVYYATQAFLMYLNETL